MQQIDAGFLSDHDILRELGSSAQRSGLRIDPFIRAHLQPASLDVYLGGDLLLFTGTEPIDTDADNTKRYLHISLDTPYTLMPEDFVLGTTAERFVVPNYLVAQLSGVSTNGRLALVPHLQAGLIDPGFRGQVTCEIKGNSKAPVILKRGMRIGQISFCYMNSPATSYSGRYQNQDGVTPALPSLPRSRPDPYRSERAERAL